MSDRKRIPFDEVWQEFTRVLLGLGFEKSKAQRCGQIFAESTRDGITSHGINRFPEFVEFVKLGVIKPDVEAERVAAFGVMEQWDGKSGIGPLNAEAAMTRAIAIAKDNGIGCVGLRNTNHWMRAGTYGLLAAEAGCIGICWTNTKALMPSWGAAEKNIGNNPLTLCVPRKDGPVLLDMAMSQFSNGKLEVLRRRGEKLPLAGGYDAAGELTTDPDAILTSGRALPIGYWKGSGLALVLDLMAALMTGGDATRDISQRPVETGVSQVFMAIDISSQIGTAPLDNKVTAILDDFLKVPTLEGMGQVRYPGQGMLATRKKNMEKGILVDSELWQEIRGMSPS